MGNTPPKGGAGSGSGVGAGGQDGSDDGIRRSKRPKNETDNQKWNSAKDKAYYRRNDNFLQVDHPGGNWVKPPMLVFFNAKGGTLKTSHTWNTAYTLSELRGLKVLTVDMDSQRDLSRSLLKAKLLEQGAANGVPPIGLVEHLNRPFTPEEVETYANPDLGFGAGAASLTRTLEGALQPLVGGLPFVKRVVPEQITQRLYLLPGSPVMEDIDRRVTISEGLLHDFAQQNWQGGPVQVIMDTARLIKADIVMLDLNPSLSTINRNMIMSSDYIVITTRPDNFSLENMDTFTNKMARNDPDADLYGGSWLQQMIYNVRPKVNQGFHGAPPRYPLPVTVPKVLGCVIADFSSQANVETTRNPARPPDFLSTQVNGVFHDSAAGAIQNGINRITTRMRGLMTEIFNKEVTSPPSPYPTTPQHVQMAIDSPVYVAAGLTCLLGKIRSYESLGPLTHHSGIPAPFIRNEHCVNVETNLPLPPATIKEMLKRAADFRRRYDQLAWNILKLMNSDPGGKCYGHLDWALLDRREGAGGPTRKDDGCPLVQNALPGY